MAHRERHNGFVEYAYAASNTQLNGRSSTGTIKIPDNYNEAMRLPEAHLWKAAMEKELKSPQDLNVCKLVPKSDVSEGQNVIGSKWVCKLYRGPPTTNLRPESWPRDGTKFTAGTATERTPPYAGFRASGWCLKLIPRRIGRLFKWTSTLPSCTLRSKRRKRC